MRAFAYAVAQHLSGLFPSFRKQPNASSSRRCSAIALQTSWGRSRAGAWRCGYGGASRLHPHLSQLHSHHGCRNGGGVHRAAEELACGAARDALHPLLDAACERLGAVVKRSYEIAAEQAQLQRDTGALTLGYLEQMAAQLIPCALLRCSGRASAALCVVPCCSAERISGVCVHAGGAVQGHPAPPPRHCDQQICNRASARYRRLLLCSTWDASDFSLVGGWKRRCKCGQRCAGLVRPE